MGWFGEKLANKVLDTGADIGGKLIKNSKNANQLDAREKEAARGEEGWLGINIHEIVILMLLGVVVFSSKIGVDAEVLKSLSTYLGMAIAYLFGRGRR